MFNSYLEFICQISLSGDLLIELRDDSEVIGVREHNDEQGGSVGHQLQNLQGQAEV